MEGDQAAVRGDELPDVVRQRVTNVASGLLGTLTPAEIPMSLRRVAKFTPARRARAGSALIMGGLEADVVLRHRTGEALAAALPVLAACVRSGDIPPDADPVDVGALAFLLRPDGWPDVVQRAAESIARRAAEEEEARRAMSVERLGEQLAAVRAASREEAAALRSELDTLRAEITRLRQRLGAARQEARDAIRAIEVAEARKGTTEGETTAPSDAEVRRLRSRLAEVELALETSRRTARDARTTESVRTKLLVDTLVDVTQGLRRELALPPLHTRPADLVTGPDSVAVAPGSRGRDTDDPALLAQLLGVPQVHLIVDGYNVTKSGYGDLPLEDQRARIVTALGSLAARTQAEITCVFDGAELDGPVATASARRVRVRFSAAGVSADDLIRALVQAEPPGRPLVVVTNDREILGDVRLSGAWTAGSQALLRMLGSR